MGSFFHSISNRFLKEFRVSHLIMASGRLFQLLITRCEKEFCLILVWALGFSNFQGWPLVWFVFTLKKASTGILSMFLNILYTCNISVLFRLYARVVMFSDLNLSAYDMFLSSGTNFVALRWTFSISRASLLYRGDHIGLQYSSMGRTKDLYISLKLCLFNFEKDLLIMPMPTITYWRMLSPWWPRF